METDSGDYEIDKNVSKTEKEQQSEASQKEDAANKANSKDNDNEKCSAGNQNSKANTDYNTIFYTKKQVALST